MSPIISNLKNRLEKVRRIHENGAQNLQVMHAEFSTLWHRILTFLINTRDVNVKITVQKTRSMQWSMMLDLYSSVQFTKEGNQYMPNKPNN